MKYLFVILITLFSFGSFAQDTVNTDPKYYLEKASKVDTVESYILYFDSSITPQVVVYENTIRVLFTMEELSLINQRLQMIPLMEEVIKKYGAEADIEVGVISSLQNEIFILKKQVSDKDGRIEDLKQKENQYLNLIKNLQEEIQKKDRISEEYEIKIKSLKKDLRKQKLKTIAVAVGEGAVIVLLLVVLL